MAESNIPMPKAKALGFELRSAADAVALGLPVEAGGILIPYTDIAGKPTTFFRFRFLEAPKRTGFAGITEERKPLRYVQPSKSETRLYLPPLVDWRKVAKEPKQPLLITEGEFKAACATLHTPYPCIGLGGVWSWKSAKRHAPMLPEFDDFEWEGRPVYIVFDSDAATNPKVMQAENAFAHALLSLGAEPYIARLPSLHDGSKCGLDDYIVNVGAPELEALLEECEPWQASKELHELNEEVVYVRDPGLILRLDNLQRMRPSDFVNHAYSTRVFWEEVTQGKTTKLQQKSAPREWLKWQHRAEVSQIVYEPGADRITDEGALNVWKGWGCEPEPGDVSPWTELLDHLFGGNEEARTWFERWCAYPIQHPGTKLYSACVLWGSKHGTGKSLIGYTLGKIYGENFTELEEEHLHSSHNEWAENIQFAMGDEISGGDKRNVGNRFKTMITRMKLRLNPKYVPSYTVRDCINYYFTSNHPDSMFLEDDDRRYFIWEVTCSPLSREFYDRFDAWLHGDGPKHLFAHLLQLDLGNFHPLERALDTEAKAEMRDLGRSDLATWVNQLKESPDSVLRVDSMILGYALWRSEDLLALYDPEQRGRVTVNGMSRELKRQGFQKVANGHGVITEAHGQVRLWAIRDPDKWTSMSGVACAARYDDERGSRKKKVRR